MNPHGRNHPVFKTCPMCGYRWEKRIDFLGDQALELVGYQACFTELTAGYFLFNHACHGTLAVLGEAFVDLYSGPVYEERLTGTQECPQHCLHQNDLAACPRRCHCAAMREVLQVVRAWPKQTGGNRTAVGA